MKTFFFTLFLALIADCQLFAQDANTLDYAFFSNYEAQVLSGLFQNEYTDIISLLLAVDPQNDASTQKKVQKEIDRLVRRLCKKNLERKPAVKRVKRIYHAVHRRKLVEFRENAEFIDVFKHGEFNCVTATALIAYVFTELDISYTIRLAPGHVFLIAETENGRVFIETTDPVNGFILDNKFLEKRLSRYAPQLGWAKISGKANPSGASFFTSAKEITLRELAGIQFYNGGVTALENKDFQSAFHYFRVSDKMYKSSSNDLAMRIALLNAINQFDFSEPDQFNYLSYLTSTIQSDNGRGIVVRGFQKLCEKQLFVDKDDEAFRESYFKLYNTSDDKVMRTLLQGFYLYNLGRFSIEENETETAVRLLEKANQILPGVDLVNAALLDARQIAENID